MSFIRVILVVVYMMVGNKFFTGLMLVVNWRVLFPHQTRINLLAAGLVWIPQQVNN